MWDLMWALKKSFKVSVSTMYFGLDKRKTRLESVLHSVSVWEERKGRSRESKDEEDE